MNEPHSFHKPQSDNLKATESPMGAADKFAASRASERHATDDLKTDARASIGEYRDKAENAWSDAQDRVRSLHDEGERYVRENPTKTILSVLGIGFLLGLIIRR